MSISREGILFSAYNQIISRGYQELSSHFVNYVLHLTEPHTDRGEEKKDFRLSLTKNSNTLFPLFPSPIFSTLPHPSHPQTKYTAQTRKLKLENSQSGNQQTILTWNTKIKCNAQIHMSSHKGDRKWGTPDTL